MVSYSFYRVLVYLVSYSTTFSIKIFLDCNVISHNLGRKRKLVYSLC